MKSFFFLEHRLHAKSETEAAVTAISRIDWITFRECGELIHGAFVKNERKDLPELCKVGNVVRK